MCGIAGIVKSSNVKVDKEQLQQMTLSIAHRGPDGEGFWFNDKGNIGFGHRRLAIIDLSNKAKQPMQYANTLTITYNGEIYNYLELKNQLTKKGYQFNSESDVEVLLAMYHCYKEDCLQYLDGMFAFAIYDGAKEEIFIARDRFGEKPFYYSYKPNEYFMFGSEMKALWAGGVNKEVNSSMLYNYLQSGFLENPNDAAETFYSNCFKLPHSHYLKLNVNTLAFSIYKYYDLEYKKENTTISLEEATSTFKNLITDSTTKRLRSNVEVGSSLSGGLDSGIIVSTINLNNNNLNQNTFSAVFPGFEKDEQNFIELAVKDKAIKTHFTTPTATDFISDIKKLFWHHEEPFDGPSVYAQYCVMKLAKQNGVKVLLDGQGADEVLAGYDYFYDSFFNTLNKKNNAEQKKQLIAYQKLFQNKKRKKSLRQVIQNINPKALNTAKKTEVYYKQLTQSFFTNSFYRLHKNSSFDEAIKSSNDFNTHLYLKTFKYGLQHLLQHADRNSMAHGVEVRLPFLNHKFVEFAFSLSATYKINEGYTKWIARQSFKEMLPTEIVWRKDKVAYEVPTQDWLTSNEWNELLINSKNKLIDKRIISKKSLTSNYGNKINWRLVMVSMLF
jgi:asparagine synthase (glutamine-hydrolysing)